ncbi:hypothetical protein D623_10017019 [Myotis brandtii]|uniref:Uncharacterized protein n=1 Tax=Myotis brandtii TaxID=109478 RepID=S7PLI2_MYOBR|nr:hypothetical protein D623_10017019 [Myotis brandtii]
MEGKWTICPGLQADTIFQSQNLLHFLCKYQKKRNTLSPKSEKGKRRLSGWDNIIWKMKRKPNALFFPLLPPHPFQSEDRNLKVCKGKGDSTIFFLFFCLDFVGGAWVCLPPPLSKMGLNPTSGCCRERLPRKFGGRERGGCFLEEERRQGRWEEDPKGATEASSKSPF